MNPKELLDRLSKDPEYIDTLSKEELLQAADALSGYIVEKASAIKDGSSDDKKADLEAGKEARERLDRVRVRLDSINEEEAKVSAEADSLVEGLSVPESEAEEKAEEAPEAPAEETPVEEPEPALVASKPSLGKISARKPKDFDPPAEEKKSLVASIGAGIRGVSKFESGLDIAKAALAQHKALGNLRPSGQTTYPVARIEDDHGYEVKQEMDHDYEVVTRMKEEAVIAAQGRIDKALGRPVSSLVAAIPEPCGPSEVSYEMFSISTRDGLLQIPTANARRGGLIFPVSPGQPDLIADGDWTAAIAVAWDDANPKPFFLVDCGTTGECLVIPYPTRLRFRNWDARFNPEYVAHVMKESLVLHAHKMNAVQIAAIKADATNTAIAGFGGGAIVSVANTLSFAAAKYRDTFKMGQEAPLSVLAPFWVRDALATDLITRQSTLSMENARARATALLAGFNLDVQWLYDTESISAANQFPADADFTIFAPGTYVRLDGGGLNIAETRDSTLNGLNQFEFFMETSEVVCKVGHAGWDILNVPVCPSGVTGGSVTDLCEAVS
jgi:hypothetical protein